MTTTYTVYTMTPRGSFSQKYNGTDEGAALKAYNKLVDADKPRVLNRTEPREGLAAGITETVMRGGGFPE